MFTATPLSGRSSTTLWEGVIWAGNLLDGRTTARANSPARSGRNSKSYVSPTPVVRPLVRSCRRAGVCDVRTCDALPQEACLTLGIVELIYTDGVIIPVAFRWQAWPHGGRCQHSGDRGPRVHLGACPIP